MITKHNDEGNFLSAQKKQGVPQNLNVLYLKTTKIEVAFAAKVQACSTNSLNYEVQAHEESIE